MMMQMSPVLLVIALALSGSSFAIVFRAGTNGALATAPLTMVASAVSLSAIGLAIAHHGIGPGAVLVLLGAFLARFAPTSLPLLSVGVSVASFALYLQINIPPAN